MDDAWAGVAAKSAAANMPAMERPFDTRNPTHLFVTPVFRLLALGLRIAPPTASDRPQVEQVSPLSQRRISATLTWLSCHIKSLILLNIIYALHRGITGPVSFCCAFRDQKKRARPAAEPSFSAVLALPISRR
jgi:hypothetical protein